MNAYLVVVVTANRKPDDPPAITCFSAIAASAIDAEQLVSAQVVPAILAIESRLWPAGFQMVPNQVTQF